MHPICRKWQAHALPESYGPCPNMAQRGMLFTGPWRGYEAIAVPARIVTVGRIKPHMKRSKPNRSGRQVDMGVQKMCVLRVFKR